jgi:hypothetical protein
VSDTAASSTRPARGYSWEPFKDGNLVAARHGAHSSALVSERAAELLAELRQDRPWLEELDSALLDTFLKAKVRLDLIDDHVALIISGEVEAYPRRGFPRTGIEAVPNRLWEQLARESRIVADCAAKLGFAPTSRSSLYRDLGAARYFGNRPTIEALGERGRRLQALRGRSND